MFNRQCVQVRVSSKLNQSISWEHWMMYQSISDFAEKCLANKNTVAVHGYVFIVKSVNEHWFSGALV